MASPRLGRSRLALLVLPIAIGAATLAFLAPSNSTAVAAAGNNLAGSQPVLVELFTSEGCSSCPPADALLARLDATQFVPGARAIVLSEHVTYWNHLGWRDPFSAEEMTERQQEYATRFSLDSPYTPQAVVDGAQQLVGSDADALTRAVARAAQTAKPELAIQDARWSPGTVFFSVRAAGGAAPIRGATLMAALAEDSTQSAVARGENAGRTLRHVAVVRVLKDLGSSAIGGRPIQLKLPGEAKQEEGQAAPLRLVVFLADRGTGHVLALAEQAVPR